jgi:hypothetical protein
MPCPLILLLLRLASQPSGCGVSGIVSSWDQLERVRFVVLLFLLWFSHSFYARFFVFVCFSLLRKRLGVLAERERVRGRDLSFFGFVSLQLERPVKFFSSLLCHL